MRNGRPPFMFIAAHGSRGGRAGTIGAMACYGWGSLGGGRGTCCSEGSEGEASGHGELELAEESLCTARPSTLSIVSRNPLSPGEDQLDSLPGVVPLLELALSFPNLALGVGIADTLSSVRDTSGGRMKTTTQLIHKRGRSGQWPRGFYTPWATAQRRKTNSPPTKVFTHKSPSLRKNR